MIDDLAEKAETVVRALEASGQVVWKFDMDGTIVDCQGAIDEVVEATREEIIGRSIGSMIAPGDRERTLRAFFEVVNTGEPAQNFDTTLLKPNGGTVEIRAGGILASGADDADSHVIAVSADVSEKVAIERRLEAERRRFSEAFENAPMGILLVHLDPDRGALVLSSNDEACEITGYSREELTSDWIGISGRRDTAEGKARVRKLIGEMRQGLIRKFTFDRPTLSRRGVERVIRGHVAALDPDQWGNADAEFPVNATVHIEDVTEQVEARNRLRYLATHDPLTGLFNRHHFADSLDRYLNGTRRTDGAGALVGLDLDGFKAVNDSWGHHAGDRVLVEVARLLHSLVRGDDRVARVGGDEFAILLPAIAPESADRLASKLVRGLAEAELTITEAPEAGFSPRASFGVLMLSSDIVDAEVALRLSDRLMYAAKEAGGGQYVLGSAGDLSS